MAISANKSPNIKKKKKYSFNTSKSIISQDELIMNKSTSGRRREKK